MFFRMVYQHVEIVCVIVKGWGNDQLLVFNQLFCISDRRRSRGVRMLRILQCEEDCLVVL